MDVQVARSGSVIVLRLNRPHRNNALGGTIFGDLLRAVHEAHGDEAVGAIVTSQVGPSWCVGGDIDDLNAIDDRSLPELWAGDELGGEKGIDPVADPGTDDLGVGRWVLEFLRCRKPTIAAMHGQVAGGGLGLALLHDIRIASSEATFTTGFTRLGLGPEMGISVTLPQAVGTATALDMLLTNRTLSAAEALAAGLISRVVSPSELEVTALSMGAAIAASPRPAIAETRHLVRSATAKSFEQVLMSEWAVAIQRFTDPEFRIAVEQLQKRLRTKQRAPSV